jgi:group I intron endonuclease
MEKYINPYLNSTGVYRIKNNVNGKSYIGSASYSFRARWATHKSLLRRGIHHNEHLQRSWTKHGEKSFSFEIIMVCQQEECLPIEQLSINESDPEYNIAIDVSRPTLGRKWGESQLAKMKLLRLSQERKDHLREINQLKFSAFGRTLTAIEWSSVFGVKSKNIMDRIRAGWSVCDAVTKPLVCTPNSIVQKRYELDGATKLSLDWCREYSISPVTLKYRMSKGMSFVDALKTPVNQSLSRKKKLCRASQNTQS